jgi:hypothetical protein
VGGCALLDVATVTLASLGGVAFIAGAVVYLTIRYRRPAQWRRATGSLWVFRRKSLGDAAEPSRRRLALLVVLFVAGAVLTAILGATFSSSCAVSGAA